MLQADEKKAFEMMMAEIDSDSDEDTNSRRSIPSAVAKQAKYADERGSSKASPRRDHSNSDNHTVNSQRIVNQHVADSKPTNRASSSSSITHKRTKEEEEIDNFGKVSYQQGSSYNGGGAGNDMYSDISISKRWLSKACSSSETNTVKCFIEREKGTMGWQPTIYRCYLEVQNGGDFAGGEDGEEERPTGRFMMSAKRKIVKKNSSSYYLISVDMDPSDDRGSESVLGKLRGNSVGNHYLITDHGLAPGKTVAPSMLRRYVIIHPLFLSSPCHSTYLYTHTNIHIKNIYILYIYIYLYIYLYIHIYTYQPFNNQYPQGAWRSRV